MSVTEKQKKAFNEIVENGRNKGDAMIRAGYSINTSVAPTKLTNSKGWLELMDKYLPDKLLTKKHKELLEIPIKIKTYIKGDLQTDVEQLDSQAVSKGLDMAYKLKGYYAPDKNININLTVEDLMLKNLERKNASSEQPTNNT